MLIPHYYSVDCVPTPDGDYRVLDVAGNVGGGLGNLAAAYGGGAGGRERLLPYLKRLGDLANGGLVLFLHDPFRPRQTFPDDFFSWVQRLQLYGPITDWVPDMAGRRSADARLPGIDQMGVFLDPLARRLKIRVGYAEVIRIDRQGGQAKVLLSGYRDRARGRPTSVILSPEEVGVVVFSGVPDRLPADLVGQDWFPVVNPPLLDRFLDAPWLLPVLLEGTPAAELLVRSLPVGMCLSTAAEIQAFAADIHAPNGFPIAVLKPVHRAVGQGSRFLDRTAVRLITARQGPSRLPLNVLEEVLHPRIRHTYEEISSYSGKQLDTLLRMPGASVHDHRDGTFHYAAPYPFLEAGVAMLREYVESRTIQCRRTGKLHRGTLRVVFFGGKVVAAVHRLDADPDDGRFRDLTRPAAAPVCEAAAPAEERELEARLGPFLAELAAQFAGRICEPEDLTRLRDGWLTRRTAEFQHGAELPKEN